MADAALVRPARPLPVQDRHRAAEPRSSAGPCPLLAEGPAGAATADPGGPRLTGLWWGAGPTTPEDTPSSVTGNIRLWWERSTREIPESGRGKSWGCGGGNSGELHQHPAGGRLSHHDPGLRRRPAGGGHGPGCLGGTPVSNAGCGRDAGAGERRSRTRRADAGTASGFSVPTLRVGVGGAGDAGRQPDGRAGAPVRGVSTYVRLLLAEALPLLRGKMPETRQRVTRSSGQPSYVALGAEWSSGNWIHVTLYPSSSFRTFEQSQRGPPSGDQPG